MDKLLALPWMWVRIILILGGIIGAVNLVSFLLQRTQERPNDYECRCCHELTVNPHWRWHKPFCDEQCAERYEERSE